MDFPWYRIANVAQLATPALALYPDRIETNLRRMLELTGGATRLRPHVKTHKLSELVDLQRTLGIFQFKCATLAEAEMLAQQGAADVLIGTALVGPNTARLAQLAQRYRGTRFSSLIDCEAHLAMLVSAQASQRPVHGVWIDLDVGMGRTGCVADGTALELWKRADATAEIEVRGWHVYDGHLKQPDPAQRLAAVEEAFAPVERLRDEVAATTGQRPALVAGGTPTLGCHARHADRQCSPGTCVLWDYSYESKYADLGFIYAAVLITRVISKPRADRVCLDLGYKAVASDNPDPRVLLWDLPDARTVVHNEEHLAVECHAARSLSVGDVVYGVPWHVCPTCALHEAVSVVRDGLVVASWKVAARRRNLSFE